MPQSMSRALSFCESATSGSGGLLEPWAIFAVPIAQRGRTSSAERAAPCPLVVDVLCEARQVDG